MPLVSLAMRPLLELWADVLCPFAHMTYTPLAIDNCAQLFGGIFCISVNIVSLRGDSPFVPSPVSPVNACLKLENTGGSRRLPNVTSCPLRSLGLKLGHRLSAPWAWSSVTNSRASLRPWVATLQPASPP